MSMHTTPPAVQQGWPAWLAIEFFKIVKLSGLLWIFSVILTGLSTGQAEVSYKFWFFGNLLSLAVLITARIEGRLSVAKHDPV